MRTGILVPNAFLLINLPNKTYIHQVLSRLNLIAETESNNSQSIIVPFGMLKLECFELVLRKKGSY